MDITKHPIAYGRNEQHGLSRIIITIYSVHGGYAYGVNCKLGKFIKSTYQQIKETPATTILSARLKATEAIKSWADEQPSLKKYLRQFEIIDCRQQELFD